ncbi:MAG: antitoxin Xre/MbcA/ParS toxin-binding domain-containing protein [Ginsengibacter sp.]
MSKKLSKYEINDTPLEDSILGEPAMALSENYVLSNMAILTGASNKPESQMTSYEKMHIVREGISKRDLELLKDKTDLDYTMLAKALSVTRATLINKKRGQKFGAGLSEKIVGLADLYSYGFEIFEDEDRFNRWMAKPNKALGGQVPYDLIDNQFGREEVKNLIGRIAYGVYS